MERIETINAQLVDLYGIDTVTGLAMWRVSWSDDQLEKRLMECTPAGIFLLHPQVFEVPKYPYIKERFVLERLVIVPKMHGDELPTSKLSYEPMWTFQTADGGYLPPYIPAIQFIIDTVLSAIRQDGGMAKYKESELYTTEEGHQQRIAELQEELFGNETEACDALRYGEGIVVPNNYTKES